MSNIISRKTYKYRLIPTKAQSRLFEQQLDLCRELYNAALLERREAYRMAGRSLNYYDQANQLPAIKELRTDLNIVYSQVLQDVLRKVQKSFDGFFARIKRGDKPGFPRFQGRNRYDSFTYPQLGWSLKKDRLTLAKIGTIRVKLHRDVIGKVKTCTLKREGSYWFVCFAVEYEFESPIHIGPAIGIDVGLEFFASLSNKEQIANPRYFRKSEKRLAKVQRKLSKLAKTNSLRHKVRRAFTKTHRKVRNQRKNFAHKLSQEMASSYSIICLENLNVRGLAASRFAKSVNDAAWSTFIKLLRYKVEYTGSQLIEVDPRYTSQECPGCGAIKAKELSERWHSCPCGCELPRDVAAALVILARGLASLRNQSVEAPII
jgi:putative transposase